MWVCFLGEAMGSSAMKVLIVDCVGEWGGPQRSLLELAAALAAEGVSVQVAAPAGPLADALRAASIPVHPIPTVRFHRRWNPRRVWDACRWVLALWALGRVVRAVNPDILHANNTVSAVLSVQIRRNRIVVWHVRNLLVSNSAIRYLARRVTGMIAISETVEERLMDGVGSFLRSKIHLLRNGIDTRHFRPGDRAEARRKFALPLDVPLVGMIANLTPWKRHAFFLDIASKVHRARNDVRFVLAGGDRFNDYPRLRATLDARIATKGLTGCLQWLPDDIDTSELLPALDVLVHPAVSEPFGRVVCEAMSAEIPVVVANASGLHNIVPHGRGGYLLPPGRADLFAEQILRLLDQPALARQQGEAARKHVQAEFDIARTARETQDLYGMLLDRESLDLRRTQEEKEERRHRFDALDER